MQRTDAGHLAFGQRGAACWVACVLTLGKRAARISPAAAG